LADPTPEQLVAFFTALKELRTVFGTVAVVFRGNNAMPEVTVYWPGSAQPVTSVQAGSDSPDDLTAALQAAYAKFQAEGALRLQQADLERQLSTVKAQLAQVKS